VEPPTGPEQLAETAETAETPAMEDPLPTAALVPIVRTVVTEELAETVALAVSPVQALRLAAEPQEPLEPPEPPATEAVVVPAELLRMHYPVTVVPAERLLLETEATAEPVALQPGLHRAMHSVVKVALEVQSVPARATVVMVVPVAQRPKRLSTAMQLAAQVVLAALCLVALAMVVSLVPVAPRLLVEWSEQPPVAWVESEAQLLHHSVEPAARVAQRQPTLERALP
jgi:hypothetical protein